MATDIGRILQTALTTLESERLNIDQQIAALRQAIGAGRNGVTPAPRARQRKPMSAAARRAVSRRMKAYWAKRTAQQNRKKK